MSSNLPPQRKHHEVTLSVATEDHAQELHAAWLEIVSGKRARLITAAQDLEEIMERARNALQTIVNAIEENPGTGQSERLVRFLAGCYNGHEFHFDLTDLRALDTELTNACIDYLNYDRRSKAEVHTHLPDGSRQMQRLISQQGIRPRLHLSSYDEHEAPLFALAERLDREAGALLKEALKGLLSRYEAKAFSGLLSARPSGDGDRPLVHARLFSEFVAKPLCGAIDGPWSTRDFDFQRVTCHECQTFVITPAVGHD